MARVALIGAGAVGQVYGRHLQLAGDSVTFYVREKYRSEVEAGMLMHPVNGDQTPVTLRADGVVTTAEELAGFDEVWLCVSSTALQGQWFGALLEAARGARVVTLQPGLEDRELLLQHVDEDKLATGLIGFMSWQAPLPGEKVEPGMRYWFPWLMPSKFGGPGSEDIVRRLRAGGCPASVVRSVRTEMALGSATLLPITAHLETVGWKWDRLGSRGASLAETISQARAVSAAYHGVGAGLSPPGFVFGPAAWLVPMVVPVDIEAFFEWHFTKVGDQTRASLATWIANGESRGLEVGAMRRVLGELG
ncbi:MAG: ketopantoate reductase [Proteobacteria bacterium]|nr:ketopantoate reductase [Pseudomonadota bacterium]MCP4920110.1 ketopantoate reductase [Pseudomonadota bacterium]